MSDLESSAPALLALGLLDDERAEEELLATAVRTGEESQFTPGAVVAERFRITALIGRGGMGDVFRADDLKLGQPVALKFLPPSSSSDPAIVERYRDEVRLGRQIAHPNVCRIYDLLEVEGRPAVVMELVEGEDLASLLRRTGGLPYRTALQIARDVCAGVEAVHEQGIVHGDLKPSNVMIDGRGRARISDFGLSRLAGDAGDPTRITGTLAYMAPEQYTQRAISARADIYALGLVLYEIFTGVRAREVSRPGDAAFTAIPPRPSLQQPSLDPQLEAVILQCLEADPESRPSSTRAVRVAFPPGDILDTMLSSGQTPPSEFVAESRKVRPLTTAGARGVAAAAIVLLGLVALMSQRLTLYGRSALGLSPDELAAHARQIARSVSIGAPASDQARWFEADLDGRYAAASGAPYPAGARQEKASIVFHYRASAAPMLTLATDHHIRADQPPLGAGMIHVVLDTTGRLLLLRGFVPSTDLALPPGEVAWQTVFAAAGLDRSGATERPTTWVSPLPADERHEWRSGGLLVRGSAYRGRITYFEVLRDQGGGSVTTMRSSRLPYVIYTIVLLAALVAGGFLARRNIRRRRVDSVAAWRVALWVLISRALYGVIAGHHPLAAEEEVVLLASIAATSLLIAAQVWLGYVALEPYVRRRWPEAMIGWARLVHGRLRDRVTGRALLAGVVAGLVLRLIDQLRNATGIAGLFAVIPSHLAVEALTSVWEAAGSVFLFSARAIYFAAIGLFVLVLLRIALKRSWMADVAWVVITALAWMRWDEPAAALTFEVIQMTIILLILHRDGLLAMAVAIYVHLLTAYTPVTADPAVFYFPQAAMAMGIVVALTAWGFFAALPSRGESGSGAPITDHSS